MDSIFDVLWAPQIRWLLVAGLTTSFVAGFFATSEGQFFKSALGLLFMTALFLGGCLVIVFVWLRESFLVALIVFIMLWLALRAGHYCMVKLVQVVSERE